MIQVKILSNAQEIEQACALLYEIYIEQEKWEFSLSNPSKLRVETRNNKKLLIDRFLEKSIWFGAFDGVDLIGCSRLFGIDEDNKFEIERYPSKVVNHYLSINPRKQCVEITRLAVKRGYADKHVTRQIFAKIFEYCENNQYSVFACTHNKFLIHFFNKINYPLKIEKAFKYEQLDPYPINFYYADYNANEINNIFEKLVYHNESKKDKTSS